MVLINYSISQDVLGYQVKDLTSTTTLLFNLQAQFWNASGLVSTAKTSMCDSYPLLGGFNTLNYDGYYQRTYGSLPTHTVMYYQIKFYILDAWQSGDTIQVSFDGDVRTAGSPSVYQSIYPSNVCGQTDTDLTTFSMVGRVFHTRSNLTLQIQSKVNRRASVASFGIKNVTLSFMNSSTWYYQDSCYHVVDNAVINYNNGECFCKTGQYLSYSRCSTCDPSCSDCFGGTSRDCYACSPGYSFTGTQCVKCDSSCDTCFGPAANQCTTCASGLWLYANNTCQATCNLPLASQQVVDSFKLCQFPCLTSEYLYDNQTCVSSCGYPLVSSTIGNEKYCSKPCNDNFFFDWTGACVPTCLPPLVQSINQNVSLCQKPCNNGQFLDWTGMCAAACLPPLFQSRNQSVDLCNKPCSDGRYLDWTNTCVATCTSPLVQSTQQGVNLCRKPCNDSQYLDWTNTCVAACLSPLTEYQDQNVMRCKKPCNDSQFLDWANGCVNTCPLPLVQSTQQGVNLCRKPCNDSEYLDWTNTCVPTCLSPLVQNRNLSVELCSKPCNDGQYFDWTNTCVTTCLSPLIEYQDQNVTRCKKPCNDSQFLDWTNQCMNSCTLPLVQSTEQGINLCRKPCNDSEYLDWNNTCVTTCSLPLIKYQDQNVGRCKKPCNDNEYLDRNNNCVSSCLPPLVKDIEYGVDKCVLPCPNEYLYPNNTCQRNCSLPFNSTTNNSVLLCEYPCNFSLGEFLNWNGLCVPNCGIAEQRIENEFRYCDKPLEEITESVDLTHTEMVLQTLGATGDIASVQATALAVISSASPSALSISSLVKMLQYIRYININYPQKVELIIQNKNGSSISLNFGLTIPTAVETRFPNRQLPHKFEQYDTPSSFIVNFWQPLITLTIISLVIVLATGGAYLAKRVKLLFTLFNKIKTITKWDLLLLIFCSNFDGVALFSSFELRTIDLDSVYSFVSLAVCLIMNFFVILTLGKLVYAVYSLRKTKFTSTAPLSVCNKFAGSKQKWKSYHILFRNYKDGNFSQQAFMFFFLVRVYVFNLIIGYLFEYPLIQTILILLLSVLMLCHLIIKRPFKRKFNLIQSVINETILLIVNINVVILSIIDKVDPTSDSIRELCGEVIIICNIAFNVLVMIMLALEIFAKIYNAYKIWKKVEGRSKWTKILLLFSQDDGLEAKARNDREQISSHIIVDKNHSLHAKNEANFSKSEAKIPIQESDLSNINSKILKKIPLQWSGEDSGDTKTVSGSTSPQGMWLSPPWKETALKQSIQKKFYPISQVVNFEQINSLDRLDDEIGKKRDSLIISQDSIILARETDRREAVPSIQNLVVSPSLTNVYTLRKARLLLRQNTLNRDSPKASDRQDESLHSFANLDGEQAQMQSLPIIETNLVRKKLMSFTKSERVLKGAALRVFKRLQTKIAPESIIDKEFE